MRVKLLGTAAGGGFPQWNCACRNCRTFRDGTFTGKARSQLQVALTEDQNSWVLLNASPDIRSQIEAEPALQPRAVRDTPISAVVLTGAEIDQILGLLAMREFQEFRIYATSSVQQVLREDNSMFAALNRGPAEWREITPGAPFRLEFTNGTACCTPLSFGKHFPGYVPERRRQSLSSGEMSLGLMIQASSGRRVAFFPAVPTIDRALVTQLESADVILFDGTFWSDDELIQVRHAGPSARDIGHVPVFGPGGSLEMLAKLKCGRKIYVHVNNTNPMLDEAGPEYRQLREAGCEIAEDGWEFEL